MTARSASSLRVTSGINRAAAERNDSARSATEQTLDRGFLYRPELGLPALEELGDRQSLSASIHSSASQNVPTEPLWPT